MAAEELADHVSYDSWIIYCNFGLVTDLENPMLKKWRIFCYILSCKNNSFSCFWSGNFFKDYHHGKIYCSPYLMVLLWWKYFNWCGNYGIFKIHMVIEIASFWRFEPFLAQREFHKKMSEIRLHRQYVKTWLHSIRGLVPLLDRFLNSSDHYIT